MRMRTCPTRTARAFAVAVLLLLNACASPKESFYTLSPAAAPELAHAGAIRTDSVPAAQTAARSMQYSIAVGPVRVPEIVDRPQIVLRGGPNQAELAEQHRWAQSLRAEIAGALSRNLERQLPQIRIASGNSAASQTADYRISLDVEQFDATPGEGVAVKAIWTIRPASNDPGKTGESIVYEPVAEASYDALAAGYSRAIAKISAQIADALTSFQKDKKY